MHSKTESRELGKKKSLIPLVSQYSSLTYKSNKNLKRTPIFSKSSTSVGSTENYEPSTKFDNVKMQLDIRILSIALKNYLKKSEDEKIAQTL